MSISLKLNLDLEDRAVESLTSCLLHFLAVRLIFFLKIALRSSLVNFSGLELVFLSFLDYIKPGQKLFSKFWTEYALSYNTLTFLRSFFSFFSFLSFLSSSDSFLGFLVFFTFFFFESYNQIRHCHYKDSHCQKCINS